MISFKHKKQGIFILFVVLVLIVPVLLYKPDNVPAQNNSGNTTADPLPVVQSMDHLRRLLNENGPRYRYMEKGVMLDGIVPQAAAAPTDTSAANYSKEFSSTNVQVEGVDEADLIKTDGSYIYQINNGALVITRAVPADQMKLMARISFDQSSFNPSDFYVADNKLVLLGSGWNEPGPLPVPQAKMSADMYMVPPYYRGITTTRALVYDISNKNNPVKIRELELKGQYVTSRRIGSTLYLICNDYINYYAPEENVPLPAYRDSAAGGIMANISCEKIRYFPGCSYYSYIVTAALEIDQPGLAAKVDTYLGTAENIYASGNNLYIAIPAVINQGPVINDTAMPYQNQDATNVYRFALKDKSLTYNARGKVPGHILNQFSMDEYKSFFRIATTAYNSSGLTTNNIYVLNENLQINGKIEEIAPGERIYSARFMGDRAYMVTFRQVDPFFVIDLANPAQPKILGKLKIPGYSDYLHPYDENHIIGFGKDTIEGKSYDGAPLAYYQGMKVAVFDVSNVNNPVEMDKVIIGDRGTDSELLNNHRALLFSREKNLLAFPVSVAEINPATVSQNPNSFPAYGSFSYQGAYIYNISLAGGLEYKGRITHISQEDYLKAGDYYAQPDSSIQRILYIGNILYTVSPNQIQAHQINDLKFVGSVKF